MKLSEVGRISWEALTKNKIRSILTTLGIIIGVAAVIMVISISAGTEATISDQITSLGSDLIFITPNFTRGGPQIFTENSKGGLIYSDAAAIDQQVPGVLGVTVEQGSTQTVKANGVTLDSIAILGTTTDFPAVRGMTIASGNFFTQTSLDTKQGVAILGSGLAQQLYGNSDPIDQYVTIGGNQLVVIGVFAPRGSVGGTDYDARLYLPITVVFQKFTPSEFARFIGDRVRLIYVKVDPTQTLSDVILQIQLVLYKRHNVTAANPDFSITTQQDIISTQESTTAAFRSLLAWVAGVSLLVGGIGIMNIMLVSVTERTREIGIRQSVGASPPDIRWQFLTEALMLSLVGGSIGVIVGVGGSWIFYAVGKMRTVIVPRSLLLS